LPVEARICWWSVMRPRRNSRRRCEDSGKRQGAGIKVNLLVNYGWEWDLAGLKNGACGRVTCHVWI